MTSRSVDQLVGHSLGVYQIERLLGHGQMNIVYMARHSLFQREVLLTTFLLPQGYPLQAHKRFGQRFAQIASDLMKLKHPHLLPVSDFGAQDDYFYLVTPLTPTNSLATLLKQHSLLTPTQALKILRPVAQGFDYAHQQGVVHGALKSSHVLFDSDQNILIANFGLANILALHGIEESSHPYAHLLSIARTFLGTPEYIAPEVVQGMPFDARADIYALGAMLFEMLTGKPPFSGPDPLTTALRHVEQPIPSLLTFCPDLPPALDLVVQQALEYDPAERFPSAENLVNAFERVLHVIDAAQISVPERTPQSVLRSQERTTTPLSLEELDSPEEMSIDPFVWWSTASLPAYQQPSLEQEKPDPSSLNDITARNAIAPLTSPLPLQRTPSRRLLTSKKRLSVDQGRRRMVALMAAGGVVFLGVLGVNGVMLAHSLQNLKAQNEGGNLSNATTAQPTPTPGPTPQPSPTPSPTAQPSPTPSPTAQPSPTPTAQPGPTPSPTAQPSPTPTAQPTPTPVPTAQPSPTPTPGHTGTVIASTSQGSNTSKTFTNPADGQKSLLIHLPNGNFVAFEAACPHEGVTCYYDTGSQKIICPRHNARFDPNNNAAVLQGPPKRPLTSVAVKVNADGTITVG